DLIRATDRALAASVAFAHAHPDVVWPTVRRHAQEMEDAVMRQHIDLYVNDFTADYGPDGEAAIRYLLETAERLGIIPPGGAPPLGRPARARGGGGAVPPPGGAGRHYAGR